MGFDLNGYVLRPARAASGNSPDADEATTGVDRDHIEPATMTTLGYDVVPTDPVEPYADMYRAAVLLQPTGRAVSREYCVFAASTGFLSDTTDEVTFWWTRNDPDDGITRFGWDGIAQKWLPLQGSPARNLGAVDPDESYKLNPPPTRFSAGDTLPFPATADGYALVRVGLYADAGSTPLEIRVVAEAVVDAGWDGGTGDAILGEQSGTLVLNPTFIENEAGRTLWYNAETFVTDADGDMGAVAGLPTTDKQGFPILSPVPGATERPFLRIGNRTYLTPNSVIDDASLRDPSLIPAGEFDWSRTTGKVVLSETDINFCTPGAVGYDILYLGARLYYDGVALSTQPVPVRAPSVIYDENLNPLDGGITPGGTTVGGSTGELYVQRAVCLPPPGISGVSWVPDGSGTKPDSTVSPFRPQTRPNGTGLVRQVKGEAGDTFFFAFSDDNDFAFENVDVVEYDDDLPNLKIKVPKTDVAVSRMESVATPPPVAHASRIKLRPRPVRQDALYFRQAMVIPSAYAEEAVVYSRFAEPYTLDGTEVLRYALDGVVYTWNAPSAGDLTADDIVASFPAGHAGVERGRVYLTAADPTNGSVEVGWNADQDDLSGHAALGFLPGWRVDTADDTFRWLPDNGAAMGVFRSPVNLDRSDPDIPDIRSVSTFDDELLVESITAVPFVTVNQPPLEDIPGYDVGSHFQVQIGLLKANLKNYQTTLNVGVKYEWENNRFVWIEGGKTGATSLAFPSPTLQLEDVGVLPETVSSAAMLDSAFGLDLKGATDTSYTELILGTDFLMPGDGQPGQAVRIAVEGGIKAQGGKGVFTEGSDGFVDPNADQAALLADVEIGYLLHVLNGDARGVYTVTGVQTVLPSGNTEITVTPDFIADGSTAQWRIYEAQTRDDVDGTLLADVKQVVTNHLPEEPFKIRLLTAAGIIGGTLSVDPVDALRSGRITTIRFGLDAGSPEATPTYLTRGVEIGTVAETGLFVDPTDPHVSNSTPGNVYFQLRIGAEVYAPTVDGSGLVDVDTVTGAVSIDATVVSDQTGSGVFFDQLFLAPGLLSAGECEINAADGEVRLSAGDITAYTGETAYFVEQMVTENNLDVTTSPINGSVLFNKPLRAGQIVEVNYFQADTNGDKALDSDGNPIEITEFLPLIVQLEEATLVDSFTYTYNPTGRTLSDAVETFIWAGVELQNFAGVTTASAVDGTISFVSAVDPSDTVQINYGVLEAFGGEQAYTVSTPPVYRKPFWLDVGQDTFTLETDRTLDFPAGHLILLGPAPLYITATSYDAGADTTDVSVFPTPQVEIGSRAVGRDAGLSISDFTVAVDYGGATGFMPLLDTVETPLLPADKGQLAVAFYGDVRQYTRANHLLEIDGYPYIIVGSTLSDDGRNTVVNLATPVYKDHDNSQPVRISVRPVYTPNPVEFAGLSAFVPSEDYDLFLLGRTDSAGDPIPGKQLIEDVHYTVDANSGDVIFQSPTQGPLNPGEYLHFRHTRLVNVLPEIVDGALLYPFYKSQYLFITAPTLPNLLLGQILRAQYTYRDPDSYYFGVLTLADYLPKVQEASGAQGATSVSFGAAVPFGGSTDLSKQGSFGLRGQTRDFKDQDRAARAYISLFNGVVLAFEQVLEAIDGRIIGDRDGKFRFFVGRGARYTRPGWEDEITGDLVVRLIWREVINEWAPDDFSGWYKTADPVFNPVTAEETDPTNRPGETDGETPNPDTLQFFTDRQRNRIKNDMDDRLLIGFGRPRGLASLFPSINIPGLFKAMWKAHRYSRLYPELTQHFSRLFPGIDFVPGSDPGYYTSGRKVTVPGPEPGEETEQTVKTRKSPIGQIANPALGNIDNVVDVAASDRLARARVWAYYPDGNEDLVPGATDALIVATPLPLGEFPVNPATGYPDPTQLLSGSGDLFDLVSGDVDLATPGFTDFDVGPPLVGQQVNYGKPNDTVYTLTTASGSGVFVNQVIDGYILVLGDDTGAPLSGSDVLYNGADPLDEIISADDGYGDTVFAVPIVDNTLLSGITDLPTTADEAEAINAALPDYRIQFDLKVGKRTGEFIDASLPVKEDVFPLPLQTWLNQKPPQPLTCIEGPVEFVNTDGEPAQLPCLLGQDKDDTGDYQIPYIRGADTELSVLGRVASDFRLLFEDTSGAPSHTWLAIYPDEIIGDDGEILTSAYDIGTQHDPATLYTSTDLTPVATAGSYTANSGVGDARPYDFLFMQTEQPAPIPDGITGILSIGDVTSDKIEVPRFVSNVNTFSPGNDVRHTIENAAVAVNRSGSEGIIVTETEPFPGLYVTTFNCDSVGFILDDGQGGGPPGQGGYNNFLSAGRVVIIRIYNPTDGSVVEEIAVSGATVWATVLAPGGVVIAGIDGFINGQLTLETTTPISSVANDGDFYDVTISVDCYITPTTNALTGIGVGTGTATTTATIQPDRLTFTETLSLAEAADRNTVTASPAEINVGTTLAVWEIELAGGVTGCTVNAPDEVNDSLPFTFLERLNGVVPYVGEFTPATASGAGDEVGSIKVMPWEAKGNVPLDASDLTGIKFGAAASSDFGPSTTILTGTGTILDSITFAIKRHRAWLENVFASGGALSNVESGDVVVVPGTGLIPTNGAVKAGTYLVRHAVQTNITITGTDVFETPVIADAGKPARIDLTFPTVVSSDEGALTLTTTTPALATSTPTDHAFAVNGRVYLILKDQYAEFDGVNTWTVDAEAVYSAEYSGGVPIDTATGTVTFSNLTDFRDAHGNLLASPSDFFNAAVRNVKVSGMAYLPHRQLADELPDNNCLGYNTNSSGVTPAIGGVSDAFIQSTLSGGGGQSYTFGAGNLVRTFFPTTPNPDELGVRVPVGVNSANFTPAGRDVVVYPPDSTAGANPIGVATYIETRAFTSASWDLIHFDPTTLGGANTLVPPNPELNCLLPGDRIQYSGFVAVSGVFLEPSIPRPVGDLGQAFPHVVANDYPGLNVNQIGLRDYDDFNAAPVGSEDVYFEVRRIRRFHKQAEEIVTGLDPLRYAYEIRRGEVSGYTAATREFVALTGGTYAEATNLGAFSNPDVNINSGDVLRVIDPATGEITDTAEVQKVINPVTLKLRTPGLTETLPAGALFEVYLEQAIVPHEQSNEQLLDLITEQVVYERRVDYSAGDTDGGFVSTVNEMQDTLVPSWATEGVAEGDYIVVDPAGQLYLDTEFGVRPLGDTSVIERVGVYDVGSPGDLDDNRGFYRVGGVAGATLTVDGESRFTDGTKFGDGGAEYVVMPTIDNGTEGQQDLRVTEAAVGNSFIDRGTNNSIQPFAYKIIRPNPVFSQDAVELVLFMRERMLSWIEALNTVYSQSGDYFVFQRDDHIKSIGSNTDPTSGLGVLHNIAATSLQGLVDVTPFANNSQCLSVLDRRFWVLDSRLDALGYTDFSVDGFGQRPVLPDLIDDVLDLDDRFRQQRYAWISFRANRTSGSIQTASRAESSLESRLEKQREELARQKALDESS